MNINSKVVRFALVGVVVLSASVLSSEKSFATTSQPSIPQVEDEVSGVHVQNMNFLAPIVVTALTLSFAKGMSEKLSK